MKQGWIRPRSADRMGRKNKSSWHESEYQMLEGQWADFIRMQRQVQDERFRSWEIKDSGYWA